MDEPEFRNSASKFFTKAEDSIASVNSNTQSESMNITRDDFAIYKNKLFKRIDSIIEILGKQNLARADAKRAAIEQSIESEGEDDPKENVSRMPSVADVARDGSLAFAALAGLIIGKFDEVVAWGRNLIDRVGDAFNSVRRWVEDLVSNITGVANGALQGAVQSAPALLLGPLGIPAFVQGTIDGGVRGYNEAQPAPNTAAITSFPTPLGVAIPPIGTPERVPDVRNNPTANAPQNQMREFAEQQGWAVTSAYRPGGGASAHSTGEAIDIRSRDMEVTDDVLRTIYTQFKTRFPGQNFDVFYEPHAPGGAHIHVETGSRAHNIVGILDRNNRVARRLNVSDIEGRGTIRVAPGIASIGNDVTAEAHVHDHSGDIASEGHDASTISSAIVPGSINTTNSGRMIDDTRPTSAPRQVSLDVRNPFGTTAWQAAVFGT